MPVGAAIAGAAILGTGAAIYSANKASSTAKKATSKATKAAQAELKWQKEQYYKELERRKPYYDVSLRALPYLEEMVGAKYDITQSPLYGLMAANLEKEGERMAAARGLNLSGKFLENSLLLKSNLANALTSQRWEQLASLANLGSMGMAQAPNLTGAGLGIGQLYMQGSQQQADIASGMSGLAALPINAYNAYNWGQYLQRLNKTGGIGETAETIGWDAFSAMPKR